MCVREERERQRQTVGRSRKRKDGVCGREVETDVQRKREGERDKEIRIKGGKDILLSCKPMLEHKERGMRERGRGMR